MTADAAYAGTGSTPLAGEPDQVWDAVLVVRYPSREAFCQLLDDPDFASLGEVRSRTLEATVLLATEPWT